MMKINQNHNEARDNREIEKLAKKNTHILTHSDRLVIWALKVRTAKAGLFQLGNRARFVI